MLWNTAMRKALIATAIIAVGTLLVRIGPHLDRRAVVMALVPLLAGIGTTYTVLTYRQHRRAQWIRRLSGRRVVG